MQVIDQINGSALFAQSAYSASIATKDSLGQDITATYLTGINIPESATWNETSTTVQTNSAQWSQGGGADDTVVLIPGVSPLSSLSAAISANKEIVLNKAGRYYRYDSLLSQYGNQALFYKIGTSNDVYYGNTKGLNQFQTIVIDIGNLTGVIPSYFTVNKVQLNADWNESDSYLPSFIKNKPDLSNSGLWNEISAYQNASATYLTAHQSLEGYATTADLAEKQDTLTFGYDEQDRISAINNSAVAGGGDVPTGTMNVSGLEYNAVNEISAYNGSAIAQYGAEKQWLVHDDTIVSISNSAQYALGVAIDNVARLMGVDETLLWSGDDLRKYTNIELSGSPSAYNKIKVIYGSNITQSSTGNKLFGSLEYYTTDCPILILNGVLRGSSTSRYVAEDTWTGINTTVWEWTDGALWQFGSTAVQTANNKWCNPYRIIGIGRKA